VQQFRVYVFAMISLLVIFGLYFWDYIFFDALPVGSKDSAYLVHLRAEIGEWLRRGVMVQWHPGTFIGASAFANDMSMSSFHVNGLLFYLIPDLRLAQVAYTLLTIFLLGVGSLWFQTRVLGVHVAVALMGTGLLVFMPSLRESNFFNSFVGVAVIPFMLFVVMKFHERKSLQYSVILALLLWFAYFISNLAEIQYALIYLALYSIYLKYSSPRLIDMSVTRGIVFYLIATGLFLSISAYYIYPFLIELLRANRGHIQSIFDTLPVVSWLASLHFPYTQWLFIDENMLTTGFLTKFSAMAMYVHVLLIPSLLLHFSSRNSFNKTEKFFFVYVLGFIILSIMNRYIPILGGLIRITKSSGWHRSMSLFNFSAVMCITIVTTKLYSGKLRFSEGRVAYYASRYYSFHRMFMFVSYTILSVAMILLFVAVAGFEWEGIYRILDVIVSRPRSQLEYYVGHYFSFPMFIYLFLTPLGIAFSFFWLEKLRRNGTGKVGNVKVVYLLVISVLISQYPLTKIYHPFNRGIDTIWDLSDVGFVQKLTPQDKIGIVYSNEGKVEQHVIKLHNFKEDLPSNPYVMELMRKYPDSNWLQSNAIRDGVFFRGLGVGVYNLRSNFNQRRSVLFNKAIINRIDRDLRAEHVNSPLLDLAGVNYFFSFLPLSNEKLEKVFKGDAYIIYKNKKALPRYHVVNNVRKVFGGEEALKAIQERDFDPRNEAIVEEDTPFHGGGLQVDNNVRLVSFQPNMSGLLVNASSSGFLVSNDAYHPGWRAWIDGAEVKIYRSNYVFKGVIVPPGRHKVEFRFVAPGFREGVLISMITLLFLGLLAVLFVRRKIAHSISF